MSSQTEVLDDGTICGKETLGMSGGLEPLHAVLTLARRLGRVLRAIIPIAMLPVLYTEEHLPLRGPIALQLVGHNDPWHVLPPFEELPEELLRGFLVALALHQHIEDNALSLASRRRPHTTGMVPTGCVVAPHVVSTIA